MKSILFSIIIIAASNCFAQISTTRMNDFRLRASLADVEKSVGHKLELAKKMDDWLYKTTVTQNGAEIELGFNQFTDENGQVRTELYEISTKSSAIKTLSKVGVGSSLDDLWKAYKNYSISVWSTWDEKTEKYSTTERVFQLNDNDEGNALFFYLRNGIVYQILLSFNEGC